MMVRENCGDGLGSLRRVQSRVQAGPCIWWSEKEDAGLKPGARKSRIKLNKTAHCSFVSSEVDSRGTNHPGHSLRTAAIEEDTGIYGDGAADAGARNRSECGDLHPGGRADDAQPAGGRSQDPNPNWGHQRLLCERRRARKC